VLRIFDESEAAIAFSDLLVSLLQGKDLREATQTCSTTLGLGDLKAIIEGMGADPVVPCSIEKCFPVLLIMMYKYADSLEAAILANANAGGENLARGALLGAAIGAAHGMDAFPEWTQALHEKDIIMAEINSFVEQTQKKDEL
jgi:ADP-ribosyl-[dinitrogen reductase] hydrolase